MSAARSAVSFMAATTRGGARPTHKRSCKRPASESRSRLRDAASLEGSSATLGAPGSSQSHTRVEASALTHVGAAGFRGPTPLLRLQSDERLIALVRRGNHAAFEALVG